MPLHSKAFAAQANKNYAAFDKMPVHFSRRYWSFLKLRISIVKPDTSCVSM